MESRFLTGKQGMEVLELMEILKKEYGITTEQELDKAIEELGGLGCI